MSWYAVPGREAWYAVPVRKSKGRKGVIPKVSLRRLVQGDLAQRAFSGGEAIVVDRTVYNAAGGPPPLNLASALARATCEVFVRVRLDVELVLL